MKVKGKLAEIAEKRGQTELQMLHELFAEHTTVAAVARAIGVQHSAIDLALLRHGLRIMTILVPKQYEWQNDPNHYTKL
jgi:transcriptional regulator of aromatic amino acid metabolism